MYAVMYQVHMVVVLLLYRVMYTVHIFLCVVVARLVLPMSLRITLHALRQSRNWSSVGEPTLNNMSE